MENIEIQNWGKEKIQKEANAHAVSLHAGYNGFIEQKLGKKGVIACMDFMAKQTAQVLENAPSQHRGALMLAEYQGTMHKNVHGCRDVEVEGDEQQAMVTIGKCTALENTREFMKAGLPMSEDASCAGCRGFYSCLAKHSDLENADFARTADGCRYVYSKL